MPAAGLRLSRAPGACLTQIIGTIVCLLYAVLWVVAWLDPSLTQYIPFWSWLHTPHGVKYVPPIWTALLFVAAPVMRRDARTSQIMVSAGIVATIAPGLWESLQGGVLLKDAMVWLIVPLGIAIWVFGPPLSDADRAELPPYTRGPGPMSLGQTFVFSVGVIHAVVAFLLPPDHFIINLGFGDIVIPRYAAIGFGLCCIAGALAACVLGMRGTRRKAAPRAKPAIRVDAAPQGFHWSVIIDGQTVGMGERATEWEARDAANALIARIEPAPPAQS